MTRRLQIFAAVLSLLLVLVVFLLPAISTPAAVLRGKQIGAHIVRLHTSGMVCLQGVTAALLTFSLWFSAFVQRRRSLTPIDPLRQSCSLRC